MMKLSKETIESFVTELKAPVTYQAGIMKESIPAEEMFEEEAVSTIFDRVEKDFKFSKSQLFQAKNPSPILMYVYSMDVNSIANAVLIPVLGLSLAALVIFPGPKPSEKTVRTLPAAEAPAAPAPRYSFPIEKRGADLPSGLINFSKLPK
jgi:hypothetical protein